MVTQLGKVVSGKVVRRARALDAKGYVSSGYAVKQLSQPTLILKPNGGFVTRTCQGHFIDESAFYRLDKIVVGEVAERRRWI